MAAFATRADVEGRWRPLTARERTVAVTLLDEASLLIRHAVPTIDDRIAAGELDPNLARAVAAWMVIRHLRNPEGKRDERIDDYSFTRDSAVSSGVLGILPEEITRLASASGAGAAFTIRPYGDPTTPLPLNAWELNL